MDVVSAQRERQDGYAAHLDSLDLTDPAVVRAEAARHRWWHRIDLGGGVETQAARGGGASEMIPLLDLPELKGKTVLDIGAWDGALSFHAERLGATVTAFDMARPPTFDLASRVLGSRVRYVEGDITRVDPASLGTFDVVLCLGVIYHVPSPFEVLEKAAQMTRQCLIVETDTSRNVSTTPIATFVLQPEQYRRDANRYQPNFWLPNAACCEAMLRAVGFERVRQVYGATAPRATAEQLRRYLPALFGREIVGYGGRAIFHGYH